MGRFSNTAPAAETFGLMTFARRVESIAHLDGSLAALTTRYGELQKQGVTFTGYLAEATDLSKFSVLCLRLATEPYGALFRLAESMRRKMVENFERTAASGKADPRAQKIQLKIAQNVDLSFVCAELLAPAFLEHDDQSAMQDGLLQLLREALFILSMYDAARAEFAGLSDEIEDMQVVEMEDVSAFGHALEVILGPEADRIEQLGAGLGTDLKEAIFDHFFIIAIPAINAAIAPLVSQYQENLARHKQALATIRHAPLDSPRMATAMAQSGMSQYNIQDFFSTQMRMRDTVIRNI